MAFSDFSGILILQKYQYDMQMSESILAKITINNEVTTGYAPGLIMIYLDGSKQKLSYWDASIMPFLLNSVMPINNLVELKSRTNCTNYKEDFQRSHFHEKHSHL